MRNHQRFQDLPDIGEQAIDLAAIPNIRHEELLVSSQQLFQEFSIPEDSRCIRVLDIEATNDPVSPLFGSLRLVRLEDCPAFTALSYVCGTEFTRRITCNGTEVPISQNCYDALISLRSLHVTTVWADAVCINQKDHTEKASQIALMDEIYTWAQTVYIWLGSEDETRSRAIKSIKGVSELQPPRFGAPWANGQFGQTVFKDRIRCLASVNGYFFAKCLTLRLFRALRLGKIFTIEDHCAPQDLDRLLRPEWLRRMWTFQEGVLASNPILLCGTAVLPWSVLQRALRCYYNNNEPFIQFQSFRSDILQQWLYLGHVWESISRPIQWNDKTLRSLPISTAEAKITVHDYNKKYLDPYQEWGSTKTNTMVLSILRGLMLWAWIPLIFLTLEIKVFHAEPASIGLACMMMLTAYGYVILLAVMPVTNKFKPDTILTTNKANVTLAVVKALRERQAFDPRDKAFALNGILKAIGVTPSKADFSKPVGLVYRDLLRDLIAWREDLIILLLDVGPPMPDTPSWIPDWASLQERTWLASEYTDDLADIPRAVRGVKVGDLEMTVQGIVLGTVTFCSEAFDRIDEIDMDDVDLASRNKLLSAFVQLSQWLTTVTQDIRASPMRQDLEKSIFDALRGREDRWDDEDGQHFKRWRSITPSWNFEGREHSLQDALDTVLSEPAVLRFTIRLCDALCGKRILLSSQDGHVGSGPLQAQVGDRIVLVSGVPVPMIVREVKDVSGPYRIIGPAFICGFMRWNEAQMDGGEWTSLVFI